MWGQNTITPPIPFHPGSTFQPPVQGLFNPQPMFGGGPGFGMQPPAPVMNNNNNNFGMVSYGVSQNMQAEYVEHISKLEPLIIGEMKNSKFRGSITNMAKLLPPKKELSIVIDTTLDITDQIVPVRL